MSNGNYKLPLIYLLQYTWNMYFLLFFVDNFQPQLLIFAVLHKHDTGLLHLELTD